MKQMIFLILISICTISKGQNLGLFPKQSITYKDNSVYIYNHNDLGLKELFPSYKIEKTDNLKYDIYKMDNLGIREMFPYQRLKYDQDNKQMLLYDNPLYLDFNTFESEW